MGDYISILHDCVDGRYGLAIDDDLSTLYGVFLNNIRPVLLSSKRTRRNTDVVLFWAVAKLSRKNVQQFSSSPSLLAISIIGIMIRPYSAKSVLEIIGPRAWITRCGDDFWRRFQEVRLLFLAGNLLDCGERHARRL